MATHNHTAPNAGKEFGLTPTFVQMFMQYSGIETAKLRSILKMEALIADHCGVPRCNIELDFDEIKRRFKIEGISKDDEGIPPDVKVENAVIQKGITFGPADGRDM